MNIYEGCMVYGGDLDRMDRSLYKLGYVKYRNVGNDIVYYMESVLHNYVKRISIIRFEDEWEVCVDRKILNGDGEWHPCCLNEKEVYLILRKLKQLNKKGKKVKK